MCLLSTYDPARRNKRFKDYFTKSEDQNQISALDLIPVKFRQIAFNGFRGEVENVSTNQRSGGNLDFPIGPKNTSLVEDVVFLILVKFRQILFSGFRGKDKNASDNQTQGCHLYFLIGLKNTKLVEDVVFLPSVKFRQIPFCGFSGNIQMSKPIRDRGGHLSFPIIRKIQTW